MSLQFLTPLNEQSSTSRESDTGNPCEIDSRSHGRD